MAMYSKVEYWNKRYENSPKESLDWYQSYRGLKNLLNPMSLGAPGKGNAANKATTSSSMVKQQDFRDGATMETIPEQKETYTSFPSTHDARVLILGCGNSPFAEDMRDDGWTGRMTSIDFSSVVIEQQKDKYHHYSPKMEFICHDMRKGLPFPDESFDLIIAKASFDAILNGGSRGYPDRLVQEIVRCLAPGYGTFFLVSTGNPDSRLLFLEHQNQLYQYWNCVRHHAVMRHGKNRSKCTTTDYVYICRKREVGDTVEAASSPEDDEDCLAYKESREPNP